MNDRRPLRVFLPCTGLGHEHRGFEAFTRDCAAAIQSDCRVDLTVFGGGGVMNAGEHTVPNLPRASAAARAVASLIGRDAHFVEQATFFAGFLPALVRRAPDLVYFGDLNLGNACWHWRRLSGQRFRLLYYNGGPTTQPFTRCDLVQQVSPEHLASALARGEPAKRQLLLPHGLEIEPEWRAADDNERRQIRLMLGVPVSGPLVLSVGALNASHKRMDYVIRETASLAAPRPHLLLLGAEGGETGALRALAVSLLGENGCTLRTVSRSDTLCAYRAADVFVLASVVEGFGLAHVEALAAGLPCLAHDTATTEYIYGDLARRADLRAQGALTPLFRDALAEGVGPIAAQTRHARAYRYFSWKMLAPRYVELFEAVAAGRTPDSGGRAR